MAIDPSIPLRVRTPDIGSGLIQIAEAAQTRKDRQLRRDVARQQAGQSREEARLKSVVVGANQLKPFLDTNNLEGARGFLQRRRQNLVEAGIDSSDTDEMIQILDRDPGQALQITNQAVELGNKLGITKTKLLSPEEEAQQRRLRTAGATQVNVDTKGVAKEQEELAKLRASKFGQIQERAVQAEEHNLGLQQLENIDVRTGFGEAAKGEMARVFNAFGVNGSELLGVDPANIQAFNAVSGKLVLDVMSTQKGPQTDKDQERIAKTLPSIRNEALANQFNLNSLKAINFRRMEMRDFYERFLEDNESLKGVDRAWSKFKREAPLLSDNVRNPETGLPMFFHEFKAKLIERNPNATDQQAINAWRELN